MGCANSRPHNYPVATANALAENEKQLAAGNITQKEFKEKKEGILKEFCVGAQEKW